MADSIDTLCIHAGHLSDPGGGVNSPLSLSTAYAYNSPDGVLYPRYYNTPNQKAVAAKLAALEGAQEGLLFASGMAAISTLFLALLRPGDHVVVTRGGYGGTEHLMREEFPRHQISFSECVLDTDAIAAAIQPDTRMIYVETPSNPLLGIVDLRAVAELARQHSALSVVDNTFATPVAQRPLTLGFDLVVHSATKYLGGHSDLCAGAVAGGHEHLAHIHDLATRYGGCLNALDVWLLERSIKTLAVRVERQSATAWHLARTLQQTDGVTRVYYPGLESHPGHAIARRQMAVFGGMLSFDLAGEIQPGRFESALNLIRPAVSLGGVESTLCRPCLTSHAKMSAQKRQELGIGDGLIRLSVGLEHVDDLLADIRQAIQAAMASNAA